jgi:hypothetical protein
MEVNAKPSIPNQSWGIGLGQIILKHRPEMAVSIFCIDIESILIAAYSRERPHSFTFFSALLDREGRGL